MLQFPLWWHKHCRCSMMNASVKQEYRVQRHKRNGFYKLKLLRSTTVEVHICTHTYTCTHLYMYPPNIHINTYTLMHTHTFTCTHSHAHIHMHTRTHAHTTHAHTHAHIHIQCTFLATWSSIDPAAVYSQNRHHFC